MSAIDGLRSKAIKLAIAIGISWAKGTVASVPYAVEVISYDPGTGYAIEFGTGRPYTNQGAILGPPARITIDPNPLWGGEFSVTPFSPPYLPEQLLSVGAGGHVTVKMGQAIVDADWHPFGIDFVVYGNAGFVITNGDYTGGGITDGSLFGAASGPVRVEVSEDNVTYYELNPSLCPVFDSYFPTDGIGLVGLPVNPSLRPEDFAGKGLDEIRALYAGSAGGTGYDLAWVVDCDGNPVRLKEVWYVRLSVCEGHAEIDAIALVVPEPSILILMVIGTAFVLWRVGRQSRISAGG